MHYSLGVDTTFPTQGAFQAPCSTFTCPTFGAIQPHHYSLGVNTAIPVPNFSALMANIPPPIHNVGSGHGPTFTSVVPESQRPAGTGLVIKTARAFLKEELPEPSTKLGSVALGSLKTVGVAVKAGIAAKHLVENIEKALDEGESPEEAYTCQTAKTLTSEMSGNAMKGFIVGGIPPYLAAAVASPPLAATVPVVLPMIPKAYQGAQTAAEMAGNAAEVVCHRGFNFARQLSKKGE